MRIKELLSKLSGIQTIESIKSILDVSKQKAIYHVYMLRKRGYVKTKYDSDKRRIYYISAENLQGGTSYIDILNEHSPIKLASSEVYKIYGRRISLEETLIYAVKTHKLRYILSALALFRKIRNWPELYRLAKKNNLTREIGALYDLSALIVRKVRKMTKRFRNNSLPKGTEPYRYVIEGLASKDYKEIESRWRVYLPFNEEDISDYKK